MKVYKVEKRHSNIVNIEDIEPRSQSKGEKFGFNSRRLGPAVGSKSIGSSYIEIEPGRQAFPNHYHTANEEAVFVVEGSGLVRIGQNEVQIRKGDYIAFPVGPEHSHSIRNNSSEILKLLCISTLNPVEIIGYPDSKKFAMSAASEVTKGFMSSPNTWVRLIVKDQAPIDYYEGEI